MINTTGNKIPLQHVEVSVQELRLPCASPPEAVPALLTLRDRPHKEGRSLGGLSSKFSTRTSGQINTRTWNFSSYGKLYKKNK